MILGLIRRCKSKNYRCGNINNVSNNSKAKCNTNNNIPFEMDKGWVWLALFASFLACLVSGGVCFSMGAYYPVYLRMHGPIYAGLLTSLPGSLMLILGMVSQYLSDNLGYSKTLCIGACVSCFGFIVASQTQYAPILILSQGIFVGIGSGLIFTSGISVIKLGFERKYMLATAISMCGTALGVLCFPLLITYTLERYGLRGSMLIMGGVFLQVLISGFILIPIPKAATKSLEETGIGGTAKKATEVENVLFVSATSIKYNNDYPTKEVLPKPAIISSCDDNNGFNLKGRKFLIFLISYASWQMASNIIYFTITDLGKDRDLNVLQSAALVSWIGIGDLSGRIFVTLWGIYESSRKSRAASKAELLKQTHQNTLPPRGRDASSSTLDLDKTIVFSATIILHVVICLSYLYEPSTKGLTWIYVSIISVIFGILFGVRITLTPVLIAQMFGTRKFYKAYGVTIMMGGISSVIGTSLSSYLTQRFQNANAPFYFTSSFFLIAFIIFLPLQLQQCMQFYIRIKKTTRENSTI